MPEQRERRMMLIVLQVSSAVCILSIVTLHITKNFDIKLFQYNIGIAFLSTFTVAAVLIWTVTEYLGEIVPWIVAALILGLLLTGIDGYVTTIKKQFLRRSVQLYHVLSLVLILALLGRYFVQHS